MNSRAFADNGSLEANLVIVGAGGAGLAAAVAAAERGLGRIYVLEKLGAAGGNTAMSSGLIGVDSPAQKRAAVEFHNDEIFRIAMEWSHWKLNPRLVRALVNKSGDTIRWLEEKGLHFNLIPLYPNQHPLVWHVTEARGAGMMRTLLGECKRLGVTVLVNTAAKRLVRTAAGRVAGVVASQKGKKEITIKAKAVIIATGGYGGNKDLLRQSPNYRENMLCDGFRHTGDGIAMATEAGAATEGIGLLLLSGPQIPGSVQLTLDTEPERVSVQLMGVALEPNTVWVNKNGERYVDEGTSFHHFVSSQAVNRQPGNLTYTLFDQRIMESMTKEGLIIGLGRHRIEERTAMPGLERELRMQAEGFMSIEQVDREKCRGCALCVRACPAGAVTLDTTPSDSEEVSACAFACPAGVDVRRYIHLLRSGKTDEAEKVLRESLPMPAITGRVCPHFCERECARTNVDDAVNINALERFVADQSLKERADPVPATHKEKTAVIGSGPAGLSCAYFLTKMGYPVTVFESMPVLGGMLRLAIPEYRLPRRVLDDQIRYIRDMGVAFKTGVAMGRDMTLDDLKKHYRAVFVATGSQSSRRIEIEGASLEGVLWGLDFLKAANLGKPVATKGKVVVIGGGNVALDAALTALRLGAKDVQIACLESEEAMPAYREEIDRARAEGVKINDQWGPLRILGKGGKVDGVELMRCVAVYDETGAFSPSYDRKTTRKLKADMVVLAIGQVPDRASIPEKVTVGEEGAILADPITLETSQPGVFAGGDIVSAGGSVVDAFAAGNRAAVSIDLFLRGKDLLEGRDKVLKKVKEEPKEGMPLSKRIETPILPVSIPGRDFHEIKTGFTADHVEDEAWRCMTCGSRAVIEYVDECRLCKSCELSCPYHAIFFAPAIRIEPHVKIAGTWDEIAEWIGAKPEALRRAIDEYNRACDQGYDPVFNKRRELLAPLRTPPYYAIRGNSDFLDTFGGIKINERMQVVDQEGRPIPGLYAAGVTTGGWEAECYNDVLSGAASGFSVGGGRIAGESAAEDVLESKHGGDDR